jgi:predicted ester cyclase
VDNKEIFRHYQDALYDEDTLGQVLTADFIAHDLPPPGGRDALIAFRKAVNRATSNPKHAILDLIAQGDRVAARIKSESTHTGVFAGVAPTGKRIAFEIFEIVRIADGKIAERWAALRPSVSELIQQLRERK